MAERRTWLLAVVVAALIAAAGISTWAVAGTAADSSPDVAGVEPDHQFHRPRGVGAHAPKRRAGHRWALSHRL